MLGITKVLLLVSLGNRYENALKAIEKALEIDPKYAEAWNSKGIVLYKIGKYEDALKAYDKALEINPKYAEAWNSKGIVFGELGRYADAKKAYEKALELNPKYVIAHCNLGELFFDLGNLQGASKEVKDALDIDANFARAIGLQGRIKIEEQDYDSAIEYFKKAISLDVGNPSLLLWDAFANYLRTEFSLGLNCGKYQEKVVSIIRSLERAERLSKEHGKEEIRAYILYFLGFFYYKCKDIFESKEKLIECIQLKSKASIKPIACELLENIWSYQIRPSWWQWWLASPLHCWLKRGIFTALLLSIFTLFLLHPFVAVWFPSVQVNWTLYALSIVILVMIIIFPSIERIKAKEIIEVEMRAPPSFEFVLSPATMEIKIGELKKHPKR